MRPRVPEVKQGGFCVSNNKTNQWVVIYRGVKSRLFYHLGNRRCLIYSEVVKVIETRDAEIIGVQERERERERMQII